MKKFINSVYFKHLIETAIIAGLSTLIYFVVDLRDFVEFKQPQRDKLQDISINNLNKKINFIDNWYDVNCSVLRSSSLNIHF